MENKTERTIKISSDGHILIIKTEILKNGNKQISVLDHTAIQKKWNSKIRELQEKNYTLKVEIEQIKDILKYHGLNGEIEK